MSKVAMEEGMKDLCGPTARTSSPHNSSALCALVISREWCWNLICNIHLERNHLHRANVLLVPLPHWKQWFFLSMVLSLVCGIFFFVCSATHELTVYCCRMLDSNNLEQWTHFMMNKINSRHIIIDLLAPWIYLLYYISMTEKSLDW